MAANDEVQLIIQAKSGDYAAFSALHDRYYARIHTYFFYRVNEEEQAEDMTAEVFMKMVEKISTFNPQGKPVLAWLYTIAHNILVDYYRKAGRSPQQVELDETYMAASHNPMDSIDSRMQADCLKKALRHLTDDQQQVVVGKFIEDRSLDDMATLIGKSIGAIKSLQHRALLAMRRAIEKEGCYEP